MATSKKNEAQDVLPGEELVEIKLPLTRDLKDDVFVRVNNRTWLIKRGEYVKIPKCAAEQLERAEEAMTESIRYQEAHEYRS